MSLSLNDILGFDEKRPTATVVLNFGLDLMPEEERLAEKVDELEAALDSKPESKSAKPLADPRRKELEDARAELDALHEKMRETQATLEVRAIPAGEWLRYKDEHPAREKNQSDLDIGLGYVNATELLDDLHKWAWRIGSDTVTPEAWAKIAVSADSGSVLEVARTAVRLQEARVTVPKSSSASSPTEGSASA